LFFGIAIGGDGGTGSLGGPVDVTLGTYIDDLLTSSAQIETRSARSAGLFAQSVGGSGGSGGKTVQVSVGAFVNLSIAVGGNGGAGGDGGAVSTVGGTNVLTRRRYGR
jgi:hypothetical protein